MSTHTIVGVTPVDEGHQVVSLSGKSKAYRKEPCGGCPWRVDQTGVFPAGAFAASASAQTAYDMSQHLFSCHESGQNNPATCAGFLLRGADHNLGVRLKCIQGEIDYRKVGDGGHELHDSYRAMAIANGVDPDDLALEHCRPTL